jgi:hypothetical protein
MENVEMNLIFSEIKNIREYLDYPKQVVGFGIEDTILTKDEEKPIKDTYSQKKRVELNIGRSFW